MTGESSSPTAANSPTDGHLNLSDTVIIVGSVAAFLITGSIIIIIILVTICVRKPKRQNSNDHNSEYVNVAQSVGRQCQGQPLQQKKPTRQQDNQARCEAVRVEEDRRTKNEGKRRTQKEEQGLYAQIPIDETVVNSGTTTEKTEQQTGVIYAVLDFDQDFTETTDKAKKLDKHGKEPGEKGEAGTRGAEGTDHSMKRSQKDKGRSGKEEKFKEGGRDDAEATATNREDGRLVEEDQSANDASPFNIGSDGYVKMKPPDAPRISEVSHSDSVYSLAKDPDLPNNINDHNR